MGIVKFQKPTDGWGGLTQGILQLGMMKAKREWEQAENETERAKAEANTFSQLESALRVDPNNPTLRRQLYSLVNHAPTMQAVVKSVNPNRTGKIREVVLPDGRISMDVELKDGTWRPWSVGGGFMDPAVVMTMDQLLDAGNVHYGLKSGHNNAALRATGKAMMGAIRGEPNPTMSNRVPISPRQQPVTQRDLIQAQDEQRIAAAAPKAVPPPAPPVAAPATEDDSYEIPGFFNTVEEAWSSLPNSVKAGITVASLHPVGRTGKWAIQGAYHGLKKAAPHIAKGWKSISTKGRQTLGKSTHTTKKAGSKKFTGLSSKGTPFTNRNRAEKALEAMRKQKTLEGAHKVIKNPSGEGYIIVPTLGNVATSAKTGVVAGAATAAGMEVLSDGEGDEATQKEAIQSVKQTADEIIAAAKSQGKAPITPARANATDKQLGRALAKRSSNPDRVTELLVNSMVAHEVGLIGLTPSNVFELMKAKDPSTKLKAIREFNKAHKGEWDRLGQAYAHTWSGKSGALTADGKRKQATPAQVSADFELSWSQSPDFAALMGLNHKNPSYAEKALFAEMVNESRTVDGTPDENGKTIQTVGRVDPAKLFADRMQKDKSLPPIRGYRITPAMVKEMKEAHYRDTNEALSTEQAMKKLLDAIVKASR